MPQTTVFFYEEQPGDVPVLDWLRGLQQTNRQAYAKCVARIERLAEEGYELRRPEADFLRDGIYELRARQGRVQFRILYFFYGQRVAVLAHGLTKEDKVPKADIDRALERKKRYEQDPEKHTYEEDDEEY